MDHHPHLFLPDSMTTTIEIPEPDTCTCESAEGSWKLTIDEGYASLTHTVCGKPLLGDLMDAVCMGETLVTLRPEKEVCCCPESCDCDTWLILEVAQ